MSEQPALIVERDGGVATLTLNDAPMNRMSLDFMDSLEEVIDNISTDTSVGAVVITGAGRGIVAQATPLWRDAQTRVTEGFGDIRLSAMIDDLNALVEAVRIE